MGDDIVLNGMMMLWVYCVYLFGGELCVCDYWVLCWVMVVELYDVDWVLVDCGWIVDLV